MLSSLEEELFFTQKIIIRKKFSNEHIKFFKFFFQKTSVPLENVLIIKNFIFFFVKNEDYFKASKQIKSIRTQFIKKLIIIRSEKTLMNLIMSFFPDPYIHDLRIESDKNTEVKIITVYLLSFEERGIAIGRSGEYIKAVNEIFKNHVLFEEYATFERYKIPIRVRCVLKKL